MSRRLGRFGLCVVLTALLAAAPAGSHPAVGRIVWAQDDAIYGANADGSAKRRITAYAGGLPPDSFDSPTWSRSARALAYNGCDDIPICAIHVVWPDTGARRTLPRRGLYVQNEPTWNPDGTQLAFAAGTWIPPSAEVNIAVVSLRSSRIRDVTEPRRGRFDASPAWSPDGSTIAFTRVVFAPPADPVVYLVREDGKDLRWLTRGHSPSWSPDGRWLVFVWGDGIYRISGTGHGRTRLARVTGTRGRPLQPRWSPDGRTILYMTSRDSRRPGIWVMNVDGTDRRRVVGVGPHGGLPNGADWMSR